jgi:excisionase family DNA binding protein
MLDEYARGGPRLLEVSHVAHRLSVSEEFVRRLIRSGQLPAILVGKRWRIKPEDLQAYLDRRQRQVVPPDEGARLRAVTPLKDVS